MMLDVCLEASGSYAHLIGVDVVHSLLPARHRARRVAGPLARVAVGIPGIGGLERPGRRGPVHPVDRFEGRLTAAMDRLPILLAHVLWLIDVCGCTYETAAAELGTSPAEVERLVAEARHQLRADLISGPRRSSAGSTSPSPPGSPRPGH
jgi:hypothetical protein